MNKRNGFDQKAPYLKAGDCTAVLVGTLIQEGFFLLQGRQPVKAGESS